jgi:hypothetical protein
VKRKRRQPTRHEWAQITSPRAVVRRIPAPLGRVSSHDGNSGPDSGRAERAEVSEDLGPAMKGEATYGAPDYPAETLKPKECCCKVGGAGEA